MRFRLPFAISTSRSGILVKNLYLFVSRVAATAPASELKGRHNNGVLKGLAGVVNKLYVRAWLLYRARPLLHAGNHQDVAKEEKATFLARRLPGREHCDQVEEQERAVCRH